MQLLENVSAIASTIFFSRDRMDCKTQSKRILLSNQRLVRIDVGPGRITPTTQITQRKTKSEIEAITWRAPLKTKIFEWPTVDEISRSENWQKSIVNRFGKFSSFMSVFAFRIFYSFHCFSLISRFKEIFIDLLQFHFYFILFLIYFLFTFKR